MSVLRWVLTDPTDTDDSTNTYTFPRNPDSMTSPYPTRAVSSFTTPTGNKIAYEGGTPATQWEFSGPLLDKDHFTALHTWVYTKKRRLYLDDHFGRRLTIVFTNLEATPKRRAGYYYSHDYKVAGLVLDITAPTVANTGPTA